MDEEGPARENDEELSAAIVAFFHHPLLPTRMPHAVVAAFGAEAAARLTPRIEALIHETWDVAEWSTTEPLHVAAGRVIAVMADAHPELSHEAVELLVAHWAYGISR